jgi:NAD(P)-dependent dehydrogenase (short-subunit alcohol dehydrogenase family)
MMNWINKNTVSLKGKTVAISGATGGIGQELCRLLAQLGADFVLLDRNQLKSQTLEQKLRRDFPAIRITRIPLDLENIDNVKETAVKLKNAPPDILILNAGIYQVPRYRCSTGLDNVFQVNFASPYYLVRTLQPHGTKIVAVGSIAHTNSPTDPSDIDFSRRRKSSLVYGNSKRFLMYALHELFDDTPGLAVTHPGITLTNISAHHPPLIFKLIKGPMKIIFMPPRKAALSILRGVFEDCRKYEWIGPRWFNIWGAPRKERLNSCPPEEAAWIFETAEKIYAEMEAVDLKLT